jgi:hypothetical protein
MTDHPFSPEEFVRLLSLPEGHPERLRAESSGMLEAWRRMLVEFEAPPVQVASPDELASADAALERRMAGAIGASPGRRAIPAVPGASGAGFWSRLAGALSRPAVRPAFALVVIAIAAGGLWWAKANRTPGAVRGGSGEATFKVAAHAEAGGMLELSWAAVPGADGYRVRFFGGTLREIARLDHVSEPMLRLGPDSLPAGLGPGAEVMVEVAAVRGGDVIAVSGPKAVRLPG